MIDERPVVRLAGEPITPDRTAILAISPLRFARLITINCARK
jgi:hypothetical protein